MKFKQVTAEIGTTGRNRTMILSEYRRDIAEATEAEHDGCENTACDICAALTGGFPLSAAHLLSGATETPFLDATQRAHEFNGTAAPYLHGWPVDWDDWTEYHSENSSRCRYCEAFNYSYGSGPYYGPCGNCRKEIEDPSVNDPEDFHDTASRWHSGQWSSMYAFLSTGTVTVGLASEIRDAMETDQAKEGNETECLQAFLDEIEPIEDAIPTDDDETETPS